MNKYLITLFSNSGCLMPNLSIFCISVVMLFGTHLSHLSANELRDEVIVEQTIGVGLSTRQAKINAYENFLIKIFNEKALDKLGFKDEPMLADNALFITAAMQKILLESIEYDAPHQIGSRYQSKVKLRRKGLKRIYEFIKPRIAIVTINLSHKERQISALESSQLAMIFYSVYQNSQYRGDKKIVNFAVSRTDYYVEKDTTGLVVFPDEIFEKGQLRINGGIAKANEVFLPQGKHRFNLKMNGYFPVSGYFYLSKGAIKKIPISLIRKPEAVIPVAVNSNFSNELSLYKRRILESYGWMIDQDSAFIIESHFKYTNKALENNFVKRYVSVLFSIGEKGVDKKRQKYFLKPSTEIYQQEYKNEFTYSKNDLVTLARQQRLLTINALLAFLSNFDQQDYRFLYFEQTEN